MMERPLCYCDGWSAVGHVYPEEGITEVRGDLHLCPDCLIDYHRVYDNTLEDEKYVPKIIKKWEWIPESGFIEGEGE